MKRHDAAYWLSRLDEDSVKLDGDRKIRLVEAELRHVVPLTREEIGIFLNANPRDKDRLVEFSVIEQKVAEAYGSSDYNNYKKRRKKFLGEYREIMRGFYTDDQLDDLFLQLDDEGRSDSLIVHKIVGRNHPAIRRIRNAYLPGIVDLIVVDENGGRDMTHTLFDGEREACDQIEDIVRSMGEGEER